MSNTLLKPEKSRKRDNMKVLRIALLAVCVLYLAAFVYGLSKKKTYTNVTAGDWNDLYVAELGDRFVERWANSCLEMLDPAPIVIRVKATGPMEYLGMSGRQRVSVLDVYKGNLSEGEEFYVTTDYWVLESYEDSYALARGFVNVMDTESEYLVFLSDEKVPSKSKEVVYRIYDEDMFITSIFSFEEHENAVAALTDPYSTYVKYGDVANNEVFCVTEEGVGLFNRTKKDIISRFAK